MELPGKIALVTGGARRIGRAIVLALAEAGADIALHYGRSASDARATGDLAVGMGRRVELFQADLARPEDISSLFASIRKSFGKIDILVNNAAVYHRTPLDSLTAEQWDAELAINVRAPALCIRHVLDVMPDGGAIINIADAGAEKAWPGYAAYCASKAALLSLTRSAAKALAGRNIRVNAVSPGVAAWQEGILDKEKQSVLAQLPMKHIGCPADVASAVLFLIQQDYVTAQNLRVDGGWHMS